MAARPGPGSDPDSVHGFDCFTVPVRLESGSSRNTSKIWEVLFLGRILTVLDRNRTGTRSEPDLDRNRKLSWTGPNWTATVPERNWTGIGSVADWNWTGTRTGPVPDRYWNGTVPEMDRNWTGTGPEPEVDRLEEQSGGEGRSRKGRRRKESRGRGSLYFDLPE